MKLENTPRVLLALALVAVTPGVHAAPTDGPGDQPPVENYRVLLTKPAIECVMQGQETPVYQHPGQLGGGSAGVMCPVPLGPALATLDEIDHIRVYVWDQASSDVSVRWCVGKAGVDFNQYNMVCSSVVSPPGTNVRVVYVPRPAGTFPSAVLSTIHVQGKKFVLSGYSYMAKN
ncbi:MAG: hypothetical protein R3B36_31680 [Polyangiaceae bacterium]